MRALIRLISCLALAIVFVLYFSWLRPTSHIPAGIQKVWKGSSHRLVIFGDDWSDVGEYRVSPPPEATTRDRDPDRGDMWTEALCRELHCDAIDNYARSKPANMEIATVGSVVDTDVFANATAGKKKDSLALFDFRTQVQQFLDYEKENGLLKGRLRKAEGEVLFTIFFGFWDLLEYSTLEKADAVHAIDQSIEGLFHNLDYLAEHLQHPVKVVIPKVVDPTFLPVFQDRRYDSKSMFAHNQHKAVFLWTAWNTALSQAAARWDRGDVYVPDTNDIVINQVREKQLLHKHMPEAASSDKQAPLFDDVQEPCVSLNQEKGEGQPANVTKCFDPSRHLFWDSIHLSGPAHLLIGQDAARLVLGNITVNSEARQRALSGTAPAKKDDEKNEPGFNLKFPPGY